MQSWPRPVLRRCSACSNEQWIAGNEDLICGRCGADAPEWLAVDDAPPADHTCGSCAAFEPDARFSAFGFCTWGARAVFPPWCSVFVGAQTVMAGDGVDCGCWVAKA